MLISNSRPVLSWAVKTKAYSHLSQRLLDFPFTIPMQGSFDSFNVGIAAGIVLFEASKQRMGIIS